MRYISSRSVIFLNSRILTMAGTSLYKSAKFSSRCVKALAVQRRSFSCLFTEQQRGVQELCRTFADEYLKPGAAKCDIDGRFPRGHMEKLVDLGMMGAGVAEEYGGMNLDLLSMSLAVEELSRGCASTGMVVAIHNFLYCNLINEIGTDEQKEMFLGQLPRGSTGCFALSEPGAGSDVANIQTTATEDGDYWILNGKKSWVTSALEGQAMAVFATVDKELRHKGLACFLVPMDAEGVFRGIKEPLMGVRAVTVCDVTLQEVRVPRAALLGARGDGFRVAMAQLDRGRVGVAAHAVGIAQSALDTAIEYARERVAFGKPLTRLPSVKDRLTEMWVLTESARLLTYRAALQLGTAHSSMAKYEAARAAQAVADHAVQILGGRGLSTKYAAQRHYRDARGTQIYGGVSDIQKRLIGHYLLKEHDAL